MPHKISHAMIFCDCGSLLDPSTSNAGNMKCLVCSKSISASEFHNIQIVTKSKQGSFPERPKQNKLQKAGPEKGATIQEKCPKCDATELVFHTAQLRSADEGQTVFYRCVKCGHKYSVNS